MVHQIPKLALATVNFLGNPERTMTTVGRWWSALRSPGNWSIILRPTPIFVFNMGVDKAA